ncbi:unnamed protein product [Calypogeia fissa]
MEVTLLSSRGVSSLSCCPSFHNPPPTWARSGCSSTSSVAVQSASSCLAHKSESSPSSSRSYRSSIWSSTPLDYGSNFGAVTLLVLAPGLLQKQAGPLEMGKGNARAYLETNNPVMKFLNRVQGSLPVVGLISRLLSPEGGIGSDRIRFEEFCTRVGRNCTLQDSSAFYRIAAKYGKTAKAPFVLIWCWAAALGAGLLRSEDLLMGATRLRVSYDIQYEVENFDLLMDEATKKREKSGSSVPDVPMESRAEKALEAMCICCTGRKDVAEEDAPLFSTILKVVFPTADRGQIDLIVASRIFDPFSPVSSSDKILNLDDGEQEPSDEQQVAVDEQQPAVDEQLASADEQPENLAEQVLQ